MSHIIFVIPQNRNELLEETDDQYYVRDLLESKEIKTKLKEAQQCLKDYDPYFIIDYFDMYYSILHYADSLGMHVLMQSYEQLHKAMQDLNKNLGFLLDDKESLTDEVKLKYLKVLKMLSYVYTSTVNLLETKNLLHKGRKLSQKDNDFEGIDKLAVLIVMNNIMQRDICVLWDPPFVEELFINIIAEVCYNFLQNPVIKHEKDVQAEIFNTLGTMLKTYNYGVTFVVRTVQLIKTNQHLVTFVAEGIKLLITNYNCKGLIRDFVREITEWQTNEKFQDSQGTKHCSIVLTEMAVLMPKLMIPEVLYLSHYLAHESYTLRNSVLNVITEVILAVLTNTDITEEQQESRDEFLEILEEHLYDVSVYVRTRTVQLWARLQEENALPQNLQMKILKKIIGHLEDKSTGVRKCAANCVTSFLSHNPFGANLNGKYIEEQLRKNMEELQDIQMKLENFLPIKIRKVEEEWLKQEADIRIVIENNLTADIPEADGNLSKQEYLRDMHEHIIKKNYKDAFMLCCLLHTHCEEATNVRDDMEKEELVEFYLTMMRVTYYDLGSRISELTSGTNINADDIQKLDHLQSTVTCLKEAAEFLKLINDAMKPMSALLESASVSDMQEAVNFFIAAYNFNIDSAPKGITEMLYIMKKSEEDRKVIIVNAFKMIFLITDAQNLTEHTQIIVNRLIDFIKGVPYDNVQDLQLIISDWAMSGVLDNSVINMLWQYFTKKVDVTDQESISAIQLLTMAVSGRKSIMTGNIKLVAMIAFGERGMKDLLLVGTSCKLLAIGGYEKPNITNKNPPFKIKPSDTMWNNLLDILLEHMLKKTPHYNQAISSAIEFIYKLCSKPDFICEIFIKRLLPLLWENDVQNSIQVPQFVLMRCNHLLGEIAIKQLNFLDETVYIELKRRNYIREEHKNKEQEKKKTVEKRYRNPTASQRQSSMNASTSKLSSSSNLSSRTNVESDDPVTEGAQADDTDGQFILDVLEDSTVTGSAGLAQLAPLIINVCENYSTYNNPYLQGSSIIALLRFMTVSSKFCKSHIQLVFTILERTIFPHVKCTILVHLSDILERYPNIVEPWTPRIYTRLKDDDLEVRRTTFYMLANLLLRDMIRIKEQTSIMALCIVDTEDILRNMSRNFFALLAAKGNHLYNVLPDIFSHLCDQKDLTEDNFRSIMKYLFGLIDKSKQMENLVDRLCMKFHNMPEEYVCRNIAYSLSLIQYNEKALRKLLDNFPLYKEFMQNNDVYAVFKQILNSCSKSTQNNIKTLAGEIEEQINSVFDLNASREQGTRKTLNPKNTKARISKTPFKKPRGRAARKKIRVTRNMSESSSDSD